MSDFISNFWSSYVAVASLLSILGCVLLLWLTARKRVPSDADNTTGHVWDEDLREANNPLPLWWVGLFVLTIVFSLGYLAVFPGLAAFAARTTGARAPSTSRTWPRPRRRWNRCTRATRPCPWKRSPATRRPAPSASAFS
ncbi:hypothetical protein GmRootV512_40270 [Variovorax sp. V512]